MNLEQASDREFSSRSSFWSSMLVLHGLLFSVGSVSIFTDGSPQSPTQMWVAIFAFMGIICSVIPFASSYRVCKLSRMLRERGEIQEGKRYRREIRISHRTIIVMEVLSCCFFLIIALVMLCSVIMA